VILFTGVVAYAVFGGADFGAGFWDLTAGGVEHGRRPRGLIDRTLAPVWEANHVWLIYCLVVLWTAFPQAFAAIMSTLYVPLWLAAFGIVLRGSGFAFRTVSTRTPEQRVTEATFAASSVITPFFFGTVAGGIASGRVPQNGGGDALRSWLNPTSVLGGALAVVVCAYLAAVFLTAEARARHAPDLELWFRRRALGSAGIAGVLSLGGILILEADAHRVFERLLGPGLPFVVVSAAAGGAALVLLRRAAPGSCGSWRSWRWPPSWLAGAWLSIPICSAPTSTSAPPAHHGPPCCRWRSCSARRYCCAYPRSPCSMSCSNEANSRAHRPSRAGGAGVLV
jgi:cytochrome bd ubiquinol oxidase subunit II